MTNQPLHRRIADALGRIETVLRAQEQRESRTRSLSPLQTRALIGLLRRGPSRVGELADELRVSDGTLSAAVASMEGKGLVKRGSDPREHRAVIVALTRRGRHRAESADDWMAGLLEPAVERLGEEESGALLASLLELILAFEREGRISTTKMCLSCRYFRPGEGSGSRPHRCELLRTDIGREEIRVDCPDHRPVETSEVPS